MRKTCGQDDRQCNLTYETNPLLCGFRSFEVDRLSELVAWFAAHCDDLFKTKLAKLLWLVDFGHFRLQRVSVTGLAYSRLPHGPAPDRFQILLGILEEAGAIRLSERTAGPYIGEVIESLLDRPSLDGFTESELYVIETIMDHYGHFNSDQLSDLSHKERVWQDREDGELISYLEADHVHMRSRVTLQSYRSHRTDAVA